MDTLKPQVMNLCQAGMERKEMMEKARTTQRGGIGGEGGSETLVKEVTYIFLWFRVKDKLAWLSCRERKTCEECSRDCSFCRVGNRSVGDGGKFRVYICSCNFHLLDPNFGLQENIF